jgi:hypothetical protein
MPVYPMVQEPTEQAGSGVLSAFLAVGYSCSLRVDVLVQLAFSLVKCYFVKETIRPCMYAAMYLDFNQHCSVIC